MSKKQNILLATIGNRDLAFQISSLEWLTIGQEQVKRSDDISPAAQIKLDLSLDDNLTFRELTKELLDNWDDYQDRIKPIILGKLFSDEAKNLSHIYLMATDQQESIPYRKTDTIHSASIIKKWLESKYQIPTTVITQGREGDSPSDFEAMFRWWQKSWEEILMQTPNFKLVMMSVKGGVGSFGEAGRITALSKLGEKVVFFDFIENPQQNLRGDPSNYTLPFRGVNYLWNRKQQEALALLDRYDYEAVNRLLRHELESEDKLVNVKLGLTAAVHWNQGNFDLFAGELGNFAKERSHQWWWIGYEVAYLAMVRLKQSHTSEAMFHSFRSVEGLMRELVIHLYPQHTFSKRNSIALKPSICREPRLASYQDDFKNKSDIYMFGASLFRLIQLIQPSYKDNAAIQAYFKSASDRNQLFHGLTGLTKLDLFEIWQCKNQREWEKCLLDCLEFVSGQSFDSLEQASLMSKVHQEMVDEITSYQP